jgi:hypothetical protein
MPDQAYSSLKRFVADRGGIRLSMHGGVRDRLVEMAVEEWPQDCEPARLKDVLRAKMAIRIRREYGSVIATILLSVLLNAIVKLVIEWWFSRQSHRILMAGWSSAAKNRNV